MGHQDLLSGKVAELSGEVSEWFKELVLKTSDSERDRGFESHPLRQICDQEQQGTRVFLAERWLSGRRRSPGK